MTPKLVRTNLSVQQRSGRNVSRRHFATGACARAKKSFTCSLYVYSVTKNCEGGTHGTEIGLANEIAVKLCNFKIAWCHYMGDKLCLYPRWTLSFRRRARRQISLSDLKDLSTHITQNSNNIVLRTLSSLKHHSFVAIAAEYGISSHNVSFKKAVWQTFSSAVLAKC